MIFYGRFVVIRKRFVLLSIFLLAVVLVSRQEDSILSRNEVVPAVTGKTVSSYHMQTFSSLEEKLKDLHFQQELQKQPYIWGASSNGRYLVTLAYDSEQEACQVDLLDVYYQTQVMRLILNFIDNETIEDEIEQIRLVEQALKEAYHIEKLVQSDRLMPNQSKYVHMKETWRLRTSVSPEVIQVIASQRSTSQYVVFEWLKPTLSKIKQSFIYQLKIGEKPILLVFVEQTSGDWEVMLQALDFEKWKRSPSEEQLKKRCAQLLKKDCQVVYRDPGNFRFYLMGSNNWETNIGEKGYISYIQSFVLLNHRGEPMVIGNESELKDANGKRSVGSDFYRIYLETPELGKRKGSLLVDGFDSKYHLSYTQSWNWNAAHQQFE
jgi:hypothetical protein